MGFLDDFSFNPFESAGPTDPAGVLSATGLAGGEFGSGGQFIADPLDLFGIRSEQTLEEVKKISLESTRAGIAQQEDQLAELERLQGPFRESALETALPNLEALAFGGDVDFQPSKLFQLQSDIGQRGIRRKLAAQGKFGSSQRFEEESGLLQGLAAEDLGRFEAGQLALLQSGIGATDALNVAGGTLSGNIAALQSNLGAAQAAAAQAAGAQQAASLQGGSAALSGLGTYLASS